MNIEHISRRTLFQRCCCKWHNYYERKVYDDASLAVVCYSLANCEFRRHTSPSVNDGYRHIYAFHFSHFFHPQIYLLLALVLSDVCNVKKKQSTFRNVVVAIFSSKLDSCSCISVSWLLCEKNKNNKL